MGDGGGGELQTLSSQTLFEGAMAIGGAGLEEHCGGGARLIYIILFPANSKPGQHACACGRACGRMRECLRAIAAR